MQKIRIKSIKIQNYRSFGGEEQEITFPSEEFKKPVSIVGYNNSGKSNLVNAIRYSIGLESVNEKTFEVNDFHNQDIENDIKIEIECDSTPYDYYYNEPKKIGTHTVRATQEESEIKSSLRPSLFGATKHYGIFFVNFHEIKEEIKTAKTSWGNINSLLGKHIQKIVDADSQMYGKKNKFEQDIKSACNDVLNKTDLSAFISQIKENFQVNLRMNDVEIDFSLPSYEDIFLQMLFKVGLNNTAKLVPIDHYGDGYISMFVMAVIKAIAQDQQENKCLFIFEEPESFLHENHQEYFYKTVLCNLAEEGHQVIYTTHSHKMVDIFNTQGLIRISFDNKINQTIVTHNKPDIILDSKISQNIISEIANFNLFVKSIEPNLNKILFSNKVILVEGPNDQMVYNFVIRKKVEEIAGCREIGNYADTFLNFNNISIIPHHGKTTAYILAELCDFIGVDYFIITDWDISNESISLENIKKNDYKHQNWYKDASETDKKQITINRELYSLSKNNKQIHFNKKSLEDLVYGDFNKDSWELWQRLNHDDFKINDELLPNSLLEFLEIKKIVMKLPKYNKGELKNIDDELPF